MEVGPIATRATPGGNSQEYWIAVNIYRWGSINLFNDKKRRKDFACSGYTAEILVPM